MVGVKISVDYTGEAKTSHLGIKTESVVLKK